MNAWLKEKLTIGDGSIRKLWGHRLMKFSMWLIIIYMFSNISYKETEIISLNIPGFLYNILAPVMVTALTLLGIGNVTDIWKMKYSGQTSDTSKVQ